MSTNRPCAGNVTGFIAAAIERGLPVPGICVGAQLIASALGARVYPGAHKEIGRFDIEATPAPAGGFRFPERCEAFHWHGETFGHVARARP